MNKFLRIAINCAHNYTYDEGLDYYLCAVLTKSNKILSIGFNKIQTNRFVEYYADRAKGMYRDFHVTTHAEMDAVMQVRHKTDLNGARIYVARSRKIGDTGLARPCLICQHMLHSHGIKRAYYTISDEEYGVMRIKDPKEILSMAEDKTFKF